MLTNVAYSRLTRKHPVRMVDVRRHVPSKIRTADRPRLVGTGVGWGGVGWKKRWIKQFVRHMPRMHDDDVVGNARPSAQIAREFGLVSTDDRSMESNYYARPPVGRESN